jgi:hypothetical protein
VVRAFSSKSPQRKRRDNENEEGGPGVMFLVMRVLVYIGSTIAKHFNFKILTYRFSEEKNNLSKSA